MASKRPSSTRASTGAGARASRPAHKTAAASTPAADGLGTRLRHARMVRHMTLKALAESAGCSESLLSKVEGGHATPSLAMLHKLAIALDTNIPALLSSPAMTASPVQRAGERPSVRFPGAKAGSSSAKSRRVNDSITLERLVVPSPGQLLQGDIHVLEPLACSDEQIHHVGEELGYVLEGELELTLGSESYSLKAGDSFYFPSTEPHSYRNKSETVTRILWVNTPPTF